MINWGIIGAGSIARVFSNAMRFSKSGRLVAVASRDGQTAAALGAAFDIPRRYTGYEALLADDQVDVVYIANIHPAHAEWVIKAAEAGKHILVEKPIGLNAAEAAAMIAAAKAHDRFLMEAFMYRCHPQIERVVELIQGGAIGQMRLIRAAFAYRATYNESSRAFNNALGGGGILDVGCYPASMVRLLAGAAAGQPFREPLVVQASGQLGPTGVDHLAVANLQFEDDLIAEMITGVNCHVPGEVVIYGSHGRLTIPNPWLPSTPCRTARDPLPLDTVFPPAMLWLQRAGEPDQEIEVTVDRDLFTYEIDMVGQHIQDRQAPAMSWEDTLGNMELLDRWRDEVGVVYEREKEISPTTIAGRRLQRPPQPMMQYGRIDGLDKPIACLVHGADRNLTLPYTQVMFDHYFERGGNCFDTAYSYGGGRCERHLGQWIRARGVRDEVVIVDKGGNPPHGTPQGITQELLQSLDRLGLDQVDIWLMHRDSPDVPVGEILEVLNQHQQEGRFTLFGVSNWSLPRLVEAKKYAEKNGLRYFSLVANQFSLASILDAWWNRDGFYLYWQTASPLEFRQWLEASQMPLMPWSSQASGFFVDRPQRGPDLFDRERCWVSEENLERRKRAFALAREIGVEPVNVALAWVLQQPFPTFPIVGPRLPDEIDSCLRAFEVSLTAGQRRWLNLEAESPGS